MLRNRLSLSIEDQETRAGSALIDGSDEFRRTIIRVLPIFLGHNLEARTFDLLNLVKSRLELCIVLLQR